MASSSADKQFKPKKPPTSPALRPTATPIVVPVAGVIAGDDVKKAKTAAELAAAAELRERERQAALDMYIEAYAEGKTPPRPNKAAP